VFSVAYAWIGYELASGGPAAEEAGAGVADAPDAGTAPEGVMPRFSRVA